MLMRVLCYGAVCVLIFLSGFGAGFYIGQRKIDPEVLLAGKRMAKAFASEGLRPEQVVKRVTEIGSGIEQGSQAGALAAMGAIDFIDQSEPLAAKEILSKVIIYYYNTNGPLKSPKYYMKDDGREMLRRILQFSEKHPDIKQELHGEV